MQPINALQMVIQNRKRGINQHTLYYYNVLIMVVGGQLIVNSSLPFLQMPQMMEMDC